tara:strand:+ start:133 stop:1257 length:1125 start_codon:yes stop_codon:yes gene_type:complete
MSIRKVIYIGLGSNEGDRLNYLQNAVDAIHSSIGTIAKISSCYENPAMGFEGNNFINLCIEVRTFQSPELVLAKLLEIEENNGRRRYNDGVYHSRTIDLDLLFYQNKVINNQILIIPHPRLQERLFVLKPMAEIAPNLVHPVLNKSIKKLLELCDDKSTISKLSISLKNPLDMFDFSCYNFIAVEGNIGAGKTSLAKMMAEDFNAKSILERFEDNPFLPKFYDNSERYAFPLEMSFLADRFKQISDDFSQLDLFKDFIISDYEVFKSLIFSKITLSEDEFALYKKLFFLIYNNIKRPDLYVYLHQNTSKLLSNIKRRGRKYERSLSEEYLNKIHLGYFDFIKNNPPSRFKIIDISERDFVVNHQDYLWILSQIQ